MTNDLQSTRQRGYPLSTLFLLTAASAVAMGMSALLLRNREQLGMSQMLAAAAASSVLLSLLGCCIGFYHQHRIKSAAWGFLVGALIGPMFGPVVFLPVEQLPILLGIAIGGSAALVGAAVLIRNTTDYSHQASSGDAETTAKATPHPLDLTPEDEPHPLDPDPED